jgi:peroxiredoxin Q/BCP
VKAGGSIEQTIDGKGITLIHDITASRWTFIIDKDGLIAHIDKNVDAAKDSKKVIDILKRLKSDG